MTLRPVWPLALAAACVLASGCTEILSNSVVRNAERFDALPIYSDWWNATEQCSSRTGNLDEIRWYVAESISTNGVSALGRWSPPHEITIVLGHEANELTVRHEMLHDLIAGESTGHSSPEWESCGLLPG
jgi:hypothetical protein